MAEVDQEASPEQSARELLRRSASAEWKLLKRERKAERQLAKVRAALAADQERLRKAEEQVARRREELVTAEAALRECQAMRAAGPAPSND